jgi:hypothetical protein
MLQIFLIFFYFINLCSSLVLDYYAINGNPDGEVKLLDELIRNNDSIKDRTSISKLKLMSDLLVWLAEQALLGESFTLKPHNTMNMDKFTLWIALKYRELSLTRSKLQYGGFSFDLANFSCYVEATLKVRDMLVGTTPRCHYLVQFSYILLKLIVSKMRKEVNSDFIKSIQKTNENFGDQPQCCDSPLRNGISVLDDDQPQVEYLISLPSITAKNMFTETFDYALKRASEFYLKFKYSLGEAKETDLPFYNHFEVADPPSLEGFLLCYLRLARRSKCLYQDGGKEFYKRLVIINVLWEFLRNLAIYLLEKEKNIAIFGKVKKGYLEFLDSLIWE